MVWKPQGRPRTQVMIRRDVSSCEKEEGYRISMKAERR
jgi:hypothetical protein